MIVYTQDRVKGGLYGGALCGAVFGVLAHENNLRQRAAKEFATTASGGSGLSVGGGIIGAVNTAVALASLYSSSPQIGQAVLGGLIIGGAVGSPTTYSSFDFKICINPYQLSIYHPEQDLVGNIGLSNHSGMIL